MITNQEEIEATTTSMQEEEHLSEPLRNNYVSESKEHSNRNSLSYMTPNTNSNHYNEDKMLVNEEEENIIVSERHGDDVTGRNDINDSIGGNNTPKDKDTKKKPRQ